MYRSFFLLAFVLTFYSQAQTSAFLDSLLKTTLTTYSNVLSQPNKYKLQVIYTQISRDKNNEPSFKLSGRIISNFDEIEEALRQIKYLGFHQFNIKWSLKILFHRLLFE